MPPRTSITPRGTGREGRDLAARVRRGLGVGLLRSRHVSLRYAHVPVLTRREGGEEKEGGAGSKVGGRER